jgi:poly-gamma-glutamate synthesis protein (capsule biosynthesis protein)
MTTDAGDGGAVIRDPYPWPEVEADASLAIVGDVNLQHREDPASAFRHVRETLSGFDLRYANLEGCLYRPGENDIPDKDRWTHPDEEMVDGLTAAGFDVVGGANNVNYGTDAVTNTVEVLDREGIAHTGIGTDIESARSPAVVTVGGTTFGFLQWTARYYGEESWAGEDSPGVAAFDPTGEGYLDPILADVRALRERVDVLCFSHHLRWNEEEVADYQRDLARAVIDAGADLVFGHGGHINQGIELYDGVPVFHCIGQFAFDWPKTSRKRKGHLLRVHVTDGDLSRVSFVPVFRDLENDVYLAGPDVPEGDQQFDELQYLSWGDPFAVTETEGVVSLPDR